MPEFIMYCIVAASFAIGFLGGALVGAVSSMAVLDKR